MLSVKFSFQCCYITHSDPSFCLPQCLQKCKNIRKAGRDMSKESIFTATDPSFSQQAQFIDHFSKAKIKWSTVKIRNAITVSLLENVPIFCQTNVIEHSSVMILWLIFSYYFSRPSLWLACKKILWRKKNHIYSQLMKASAHLYFCIFIC